jgi:hypothetical protein
VDRLLFLSHATEDKPLVQAFSARARRFLLTTWRDEQLRAGDLLWSTVEEGLDLTFVALLFLTEDSVAAASMSGRRVHR